MLMSDNSPTAARMLSVRLSEHLGNFRKLQPLQLTRSKSSQHLKNQLQLSQPTFMLISSSKGFYQFFPVGLDFWCFSVSSELLQNRYLMGKLGEKSTGGVLLVGGESDVFATHFALSSRKRGIAAPGAPTEAGRDINQGVRLGFAVRIPLSFTALT